MGSNDTSPKPDAAEKTARPASDNGKASVNTSAPGATQEETVQEGPKGSTALSLLNTPPDQRNRQWLEDFLNAVPDAAFKIEDNPVFQAPDGFFYIKLISPATDPVIVASVAKTGTASFQSNTLRNLCSPYLLEKGLGAALFTQEDTPSWVFSYGDIVNLYLHGSFLGTNGPFLSPEQKSQITAETETVAGPLPAELLPPEARTRLRIFLQAFYKDPRVLLTIRKDLGIDLIFNATPDKFESEEHFKLVFQSISWFLPRDFTFTIMDDETLPFEAL